MDRPRAAAVLTALALASTAAAPCGASDVNTWYPNAADNTMPAPNGIPQNISPSATPGSIRELMAAVRRFQERTNATVTSSGSANAQTLTYSVPPTACITGDTYMFIAGFTNSGAMTLGNGACTAPVKLGTSSLSGGEVVSDRAAIVVYDGTNWQLLSGGGGSVVATSGCLLVDATPANCLLISASTSDVLLVQ